MAGGLQAAFRAASRPSAIAAGLQTGKIRPIGRISRKEAGMARMPGWFVWTSSAELGAAVLTARKAMGLTQGALAVRARVGEKFLYNLERGKGTLRVDKVMAVLSALGLMPLIVPVELLGALR
jgi:y4mF family transcriptional regulator